MKAEPVGTKAPAQGDWGGGAVQAVALGAFFGINLIGSCVALAMLVFAGPLLPTLPLGSGLFLFGAAVMAFALAAGSAFPSAVGSLQSASIVILLPALAAASGSLAGDAPGRAATAIAIIGLTTLASGILQFAIGRFGLVRFVRLVPYSVAAGFLACVGWIQFSSGASLLAGLREAGGWLGVAGDADRLLRLGPGLLLALAMLAAARGRRASLWLPALFLAGVAGFYAVLWASGTTLADARAAGHLPAIATATGDAPAWPGLFGEIRWERIPQALPQMAAAVLMSLMGLALTLSGAELGTRRDVDIPREMRLTGAANIAIGLAGGPGGYMTSGNTLLAASLGVERRLLGLTVAAVLALGLVLAGPIVGHLPVFVALGILMFVGLSLLRDWLVLPFARMAPREWLVIPLILVIALNFGFPLAILSGVLIAMVVFVLNYARLPVIRFEGDGASLSSRVDRGLADAQLLAERAGDIRIFSLQGFLFFGSAESLLAAVRRALSGDSPPRFVILQLRDVVAIDQSACAVLMKLGQVALGHGAQVVLAGARPELLAALARSGMGLDDEALFPRHERVDQAMEACEDAILAAERDAAGAASGATPESLFPPALLALCTRVEAKPGDTLIRHGQGGDEIYLLVSGRVSIRLEVEGGGSMRLRSMSAGAIVGEAAHYLGGPRTADVVVDEAAVLYRLPGERLRRLEDEDPRAAAQLHRFVAATLAEKISTMNRILRRSD